MVAEAGCGTTSNVGSPVITGIEGAFTGKAFDPETDPTGLGMLLAKFDGGYWPIQVCGDSGVGAPYLSEDAKNGNVLTTYQNFGAPVTAHGCLMKCDYKITVSLAAEVIVAKIDGRYNIIRVRHTSSTIPVFGSSSNCRCCGVVAQRTIFKYRILSVDPPNCGDYRACDEFTADPGENCLPTTGNPLSVVVGCLADTESVFEDITDWSISACGAVTILSVECTADVPNCVPSPSITEESEICECTTPSGTVADVTRIEIYATVTCNDCDYQLLIYTETDRPEPCALTDVPIGTVDVEACGLPDLEVGDRLIVAKVPVPPHSPPYTCPQVKYYVIRACNVKDCDDPCDPPPPPPVKCCGLLCTELPALTATVEVADCWCACTTSTLTLTKQTCIPGTEKGEWRWESTPAAELCETALGRFKMDKIIVRCDDPTEGNNGWSIEVTGATGTLIESSCVEGAFYFVFSFTNLPLCLSKMPGGPGEDLSCTATITITE